MSNQKIPKITPFMISRQPDQTSEIINRIIDRLNEIE